MEQVVRLTAHRAQRFRGFVGFRAECRTGRGREHRRYPRPNDESGRDVAGASSRAMLVEQTDRDVDRDRRVALVTDDVPDRGNDLKVIQAKWLLRYREANSCHASLATV